MSKEINVMKKILRSSLIISLLCLSVSNSFLYAKVDVEAQKKLIKELNEGIIPQFTPDEQHPHASQLITHILVNYHYRKPLIDDSFSEQVFEHVENMEKVDDSPKQTHVTTPLKPQFSSVQSFQVNSDYKAECRLFVFRVLVLLA